MGQRSATETLAGVYQAFLSRRTWKQSDLARELGVSPEVLRRVLYELQEKGMPLEREEDRQATFRGHRCQFPSHLAVAERRLLFDDA